MKHDNVGEMHNLSVLLDYGLECVEFAAIDALLDELKVALDSAGAQNIELFEESKTEGSVEFDPPPLWDIPEPDVTSSMQLDMGSIVWMNLHIAHYDTSDEEYPLTEERLRLAGEKVVEDAAWHGVRPRVDMDVHGKDVSIRLDVEVDHHPDERFPPDIAVDFYEDVIDSVANHFPGGPEVEIPERVEPKRGMVIDHPGYTSNLTIDSVKDNGDILANQKGGGTKIVLSGETAESNINEWMVVKEPIADLDSAQAEIDEAIDRALERSGVEVSGGGTVHELREEISRSIEQSVSKDD